MLPDVTSNRLGPSPGDYRRLSSLAAGILALTNVTPATSHRVLMMIFALMGAGAVCSSTAEWRFPDYCSPGHMPDASALWNLNRQISFSLAALLTLLLNVRPARWRRRGRLSPDLYCRRRYHPAAPYFTRRLF